MKLNDVKLEDLICNNLHILARKLFYLIDYKSEKKYTYYESKKVIVGYKYEHPQGAPTYYLVSVPIYDTVKKNISKYMFDKYNNNISKNVGVSMEEVDVTYGEVYNRLVNSKRKDKETELNKLFSSYYKLADEYYALLSANSYISKDYLNRVSLKLLPAMESFVKNSLNKN